MAAVAAAFAAIVTAALSFRAATRANATSDRKVDLEEFRDAQQRYKEMLAEADRHVERVRAQLERVQDQLAREQDVSNALRNEIRALQGQVDLLERSMSRNYRDLAAPGSPGKPQDPPPATPS